MFPEYEQIRCDMLEVVTGAGVACSHYEVKDSTTNHWVKLCNRLWDTNSGVFRGHVPHEGSKKFVTLKRKCLRMRFQLSLKITIRTWKTKWNHFLYSS